MKNTEILNTEILRARFAQLEYNTENFTVEEVRKIYIEETGQEPPGEITLYHSDEIKELIELRENEFDSGFDGTVIHIYDFDKGINQSYTITRGTEDLPDWMYNTFGIFSGKVENQYRVATKFDEYVTTKINEEVAKDIKKRNQNEVNKFVELEKRGIGHSLGGNLIQMLHLTSDSFKDVYAINDAPPSAYQLATIDLDFKTDLSKYFRIDPDDDSQLYSLDPTKLKVFAEDYYAEKGKSIHHTTIQEEFLYGVMSIRGFLDLGSRNVVSTYDFTDGIGKRIDKISDKNIETFQSFLRKHAPAYDQKGMDGLMGSMFGVDEEFFTLMDSIKSDVKKLLKPPEWKFTEVPVRVGGMGGVNFYVKMPFPIPEKEFPTDLFSNLGDLYIKASEIRGKLKELQELLPVLRGMALEIGSSLLEEIVSYLEKISDSLWNIVKAIGSFVGDIGINALKNSFSLGLGNQHDYGRSIVELAETMETEINNINNYMDNMFLDIEKFIEEWPIAIEAHSMDHVTNALAEQEGKRYSGKDMIRFKTAKGGKKIEVNLSSAVRIYQTGLDKYQEMEYVLNRWRKMYYSEYVEDFGVRKKRLLDAIYQMEANPSSYKYLVPASNVRVTKIAVHDHILPLDDSFANTFEGGFHHFQLEMEKGMQLLNEIRTSIEEMFEEDKKISAIFDLR